MKRILAWSGVFLLLVLLLPTGAAAAGGVENRVLTDAGTWETQRDAMPGQELRCRAVAALRGGEGCVLRGVFSEGVTFVGLDAVECGGQAVNASYYTLASRRISTQSAFEIHLAAAFAPAGETELTVVYRVKLNDAALSGTGQNLCGVTVSTGPGGEYAGESVRITTHSLQLYRGVTVPDGDRQTNPISGACFSLYGDAALRTRVAFRDLGGGVYLACAAADCPHPRHEYLLPTPENGRIRLEGLASGTYFLREERTPQGYRPAADALEIRIEEDGAVFSSGQEAPDATIRLIEQRAAESSAKERRADPLAFYERGCRVMAAAIAALALFHRFLI